MTTKIELGSFSRNEKIPIMLKEKVERDGSSSVRIYQRKDIDSITSFKDKIKTRLKYGLEDFCMKHETFRPLLQSVGVKGINRLKPSNPKSMQDLLQSIRSEARTGTVTEKNELKLKQILATYALPEDYEINFCKGKYNNEDFFYDLNKLLSSDNNFVFIDLIRLKGIKEAFMSKGIYEHKTITNFVKLIQKIKESLDNHFKKQTQLMAAQPGKSTNSSDTHFSRSSTTDIHNLHNEIMWKLNEIENDIKERSINPKDEDIKNHLLSSIKHVIEDGDTWADSEAQKKTTEIRTTIDIYFSTSWWISKERKLESLKKIQDFFKPLEKWLPEPVKNRIYPEQKTASVSPTIDLHPDNNPYVNIKQ